MAMCDRMTAMLTGGMMTDDFPDYDWRAAYAWGEDPGHAARNALKNLES
jgi:hypothetical protein